jgi:predicted GNAT family acetyltransferase
MSDYEEILNNHRNGQFEYLVGNDKAILTYRIKEETMFFMHTMVPDRSEGQGIGSLLAERALMYAKLNGYKIVPLCPFVLSFVNKNPQWKEMYDTAYYESKKK